MGRGKAEAMDMAHTNQLDQGKTKSTMYGFVGTHVERQTHPKTASHTS
jgi:hypothetical protein